MLTMDLFVLDLYDLSISKLITYLFRSISLILHCLRSLSILSDSKKALMICHLFVAIEDWFNGKTMKHTSNVTTSYHS